MVPFHGEIADITREMGRRAGVPVAISPLPTASAVLQAVQNGDADIGPKLYGLLVAAGLQSVNMSLVHPFHLNQEEKVLILSTLVNIADAVLSEALAQPSELEQVVAELQAFTDDPTTIVGLPRVFQAWGRRA